MQQLHLVDIPFFGPKPKMKRSFVISISEIVRWTMVNSLFEHGASSLQKQSFASFPL
ncbi:hypothetical protein B4113_3477 [Geobacillus sp. B4113_201601]|nr:hypothetical protein B4113_3477 [Geobacillus sp. B4113_201601]